MPLGWHSYLTIPFFHWLSTKPKTEEERLCGVMIAVTLVPIEKGEDRETGVVNVSFFFVVKT